jgi:DNA-binding IclR family transcriptional regulator
VPSPTGTQAVDRAALLLTRVVHDTEPVTFTELISASGLAKSTTSRLLTALERNRLVRRDTDGRFRPGELFVRYAWQADSQAALAAVARPFLDRLGDQTGETVNLGVASAGAVQQIAQVDSRYMIGGTNWVGLAVPLHCSALGKVLLAFGAAELPGGRLERRTAATITSRASLGAELAAVRDRGYAVTAGELEPGLVAVAAPVQAGGGATIAAVSVSGPGSRLTTERAAAVAAHCAAAASALSGALGRSQRPGPSARAETTREARSPQEEGAA